MPRLNVAQEIGAHLEIALCLLQMRHMGALLEDLQLRMGQATLHRLRARRGYLIVPSNSNQRRHRNLTEVIDPIPVLQITRAFAIKPTTDLNLSPPPKLRGRSDARAYSSRHSAERRCCPMTSAHQIRLTPRMQKAVEELNLLINTRFAQAVFTVEEGFDPEGIYLVTAVDIADTDDVIAVVGDRLVELQVNEGLPVY